MAQSIQLREINSAEFLREIHRFLWTEPQFSAGAVDAGWNCRDHALVVGLLLASFGHRVVLAVGEATFVRGAKGASTATTYFQRPHHWLIVEGVGAIDLSIKPDFECTGDRYLMPLTSVFANTWHPRGRGKAHFLTSVEAFRHAEQELPRQRNHATAIYLTRECEYIHEGHVTHSAGWNSSSLTMFLDARFGDACGAYAALVLHLRTVLLRNAPCLGGRPFHAAWEQVIHGRDGAVERVMAYVRPYLPDSFIAEPTSIVPQVAGTFHLSQRPRPDHIST